MPKKINHSSEVDSEIRIIVRHLSNGRTISEISDLVQSKKRTIEDKILRTRMQFNCNNVGHLIAFFLREKLIK